ncbi:MAG: RimK family alpha-L-glutamate ligase [Candidatus Bathyarchaeia archaeon]
MKFGILTRNSDSWSSTQLREALAKRDIACTCLSFPRLIAHVGYRPRFKATKTDTLQRLNALIVRPIGRGSIEELIFRMDSLYRLERLGLYTINPPEAIEHCVDKYDVLAILEENGIPVPRTAITENVNEALEAFDELGGDIVTKPLFGSRGIGSTRITDAEIATTVFRAIRYYHGVIYLQEFVQHGFSDIRAFVIGDQVVAAMKRVANSWKTNYSQGGRPKAVKLASDIEGVAIKSAKSVECKIAGIDILESQQGPAVIDVNSQPGWKGLQSVTKTSIAGEIIDFILSELKK